MSNNNQSSSELSSHNKNPLDLLHVEERLRYSFSQAAVGMAYTDEAGKYVLVNEQLCKLLGYSEEELLTKTFKDILHPDDVNDEIRAFSRLLKGDIPYYQLEKRKRRRDGSYIWVNVVTTLIRDHAQDSVYRFTIIQDISRQKAAEEALQDLNATLEHRIAERTKELSLRNRELDQFAYVVSHDLRAPLRAIKHLADWIMEDAGDALPPQSANHLRQLHSRILRMDTMLVDLLAYSRVGRQPANIGAVDLGQLIDDAIALVEPPRGFTITRDAELPTVKTFPVPLKTVISNLVENAVKHHDKDVGKIHVTAEVNETTVHFAVSDDGPGISSEDEDKIFDLFQTLKPRDDVEGTGIGLSLVQKSVQHVGGKVWLDTTNTEGTTVRFTWPLEIPISADPEHLHFKDEISESFHKL